MATPTPPTTFNSRNEDRMAKIRVKAAEGRRVRDPRNNFRVIPESGIAVDENDLYWLRRLRDKDVETVSGS
jgi:hypothetical protein